MRILQLHFTTLKHADLGNHLPTVKSVHRRHKTEFSGRYFTVPHGKAEGSRASCPLDRHGVNGGGLMRMVSLQNDSFYLEFTSPL